MGVKFSRDAANRTKKAVIAVERSFADLGGGYQGGNGSPFMGFWARITSMGTNADTDYKYSWTKVEMQATGLWADKTEWGTGDKTKTEGFAIEAMYRSAYVPKGSIVWMWPAFGQDFYLFAYEGYPRWGRVMTNIEALSGSTYGEGLIKFERQIVQNTEQDNYHTTHMKVYNASSTAINAPVDTQQDAVRVMVIMVMGRWHVIWQDCEDL